MNIHKFNVKPKTIPSKKNDSLATITRGKISGSKSKFDYLENF